MCGRYSFLGEDDLEELKAIIKEINRKLEKSPEPEEYALGEIFPSNKVPVLLPGQPGFFRPVLMNWGFPRWDGKGVIINAKAETLLEKPMFRKPFMTNRCLIPADGFYEWSHHVIPIPEGAALPRSASGKTKYYFKLPGKTPMYMAGIWNSFQQEDGMINPFVILTANANESVAPFHNRMPVILQGEEREMWLTDFEKSQALLTSLQLPPLAVLPARRRAD